MTGLATTARRVAARLVAVEGGTLVHPYNDPLVIAGQGTIGLEILEAAAVLGVVPDAVLIPCGGGGLSAGIAPGAAHATARCRDRHRRARGLRRLRAFAARGPDRNQCHPGRVDLRCLACADARRARLFAQSAQSLRRRRGQRRRGAGGGRFRLPRAEAGRRAGRRGRAGGIAERAIPGRRR